MIVAIDPIRFWYPVVNTNLMGNIHLSDQFQASKTAIRQLNILTISCLHLDTAPVQPFLGIRAVPDGFFPA